MADRKLQAEIEDLRRRLEEAEETIHAIRSGDVDAFVVEEAAGHRIYTLESADRPYRLLVEQMQQGAATLQADGTIVYCNLRLAELLEVPHERLVGAALHDFVAPGDRAAYDNLLGQGRNGSGQGETRLQRADGVLLPAYLTFNSLPKDCGADIGVLVTDLTSQRHHEQLTAAHQALQLSEATRRFAMQAAKTGSWTWDATAGTVTWSEETYELFGVDPRTPLVYESWRNAVHPDDRERADAAARRAMECDHDFAVEYRIRHPIRGERWLTSIGRIVDPLQRPGYMTGISMDITEGKRAEQALREVELRFRQLADTLPVLVWVSDVSKACTWFNKCWLDFSGRPLKELVGDGWVEDVHPDDRARCMSIYATHFDARQPFVMEYRLRRHDGEYRWVEDDGTPWFDSHGKFVGYVGSCVDFTDRKRAEDTLRQLAADLADGARRKDEFLATLAHELRNPLAPIQNAVQILALAGGNPQAVPAATDMLGRQVRQMVRLVDDLLDISRISRGKIELRRGRVALGSVIDQAVETARPLAQSLRHDLSVTLPPEPIFVNGDPTRLAQVVGNLLSNACKFTEKGGRIRLSVEREGEKALIRVVDNGIGIATGELPRIFDMFAQVDSSLERAQSGLGIGLTLVKRLVEMHGGTVEVHSAGVGQGSEFVVRLPALPDVAKPLAPELADSPSTFTQSRRILVVDDNRDSATSLAMLLKMDGHETQLAHDGVEAVAAAATFNPDLVLLDIGLPKLNGYEAARKIREQPSGKNMMLVAVTGWGQEEDRRRSQGAGFDLHMVKPVDYPALTKLLASLPQGRSAR